jgi:hypothetical protein
LLRRVQRADFGSQAEYDYARGRQDLQVRDLRRYGIQGLLLDSYAEYTEVLERLGVRFRRRRVFVSGSAASYAPYSDEDGQDFARTLGAQLIEAGFDLVTGFGLGIGPYLLNGILEGLERGGTRSVHDRVTLRPFPQGISDPNARAQRWREYRRDMISNAGIAVFVFGNRRNAQGDIEAASGVREEFDLAAERGLALVPVGATGSMSRELHEIVLAQFDQFFPAHPAWRDALVGLGEDVDRHSHNFVRTFIWTSLRHGQRVWAHAALCPNELR